MAKIGNKKIVISLIVVLLLMVGGVFWWQSQKEVRELNKNLPEGVRVVKSFFGEEYKVVNKIDGYEFKVPAEWRGLKEVKYYEEEEGKEEVTGLSLKGLEGKEKSFGIIYHKLNQKSVDLEDWVEERFQKFKLSEAMKLEKNKVGNFEVIKVTAEEYFADFAWYFFQKNSKIYEIDGISEEFISDIILNGKW